MTTDTNQENDGLGAQKIDAAGIRQWTNNGVTLIALQSLSISAIRAASHDSAAIVTFVESPDDISNCVIKAFKVDLSGNLIWGSTPITVSSYLSGKGYESSDMNSNHQFVEVWMDKRNDANGDIYLQNINPDGTLGPLPVGLCDYVIGDVNDNGEFNGLDVVYAVNYFKGGAHPPYFCRCQPGDDIYIAGDVNGDCDFSGLDVTYMVNYLKGGADPIPCPDCPPSG